MSAVLDNPVLDNPWWHSLTGPHAHFAETVGMAHRYRRDVSVFTGIPDERDEATWRDLATLAGPGKVVSVSGADVAPPPATWEQVMHIDGVQMVDVGVDAAPDDEAVVLGADDADDMADLVARAQPGPWCPNTWQMGTYLGIRHDGRLIAMAGERLHPPGWSEISAVATDEAYRGRGYGGRLVRAMVHVIRSRGEQAMLHASATNVTAIRLYAELGFEVRRPVLFASYRTPASPSS